MIDDHHYVFIVGSPRSGTTLLGDILNQHPKIREWYEPVFIWERFFRNASDDVRTAEDAKSEIKDYIRNAFDHFRDLSKKEIIVDKSPGLSLPFKLEIFPNSRYIHILRDGRDVTLSIRNEWLVREKIYNDIKNFREAIQTIKVFLDLQPFLEHKLSALWFEIGSLDNIFKGRRSMLYRVRRWKGHVGWGPQFKDWDKLINEIPLVQFNALQWKSCVESIIAASKSINSNQYLELRYEDLISQPEEELGRIFDFLNIETPPSFSHHLPTINHRNFNKWEKEFSSEEKKQIGQVIHPILSQLGYAKDDRWYTNKTSTGAS